MPHPSTLTFDLESGVRITCDAGYLCASLLGLCSLLRVNVRDRHTSDAHNCLMPPPPPYGNNNNN